MDNLLTFGVPSVTTPKLFSLPHFLHRMTDNKVFSAYKYNQVFSVYCPNTKTDARTPDCYLVGVGEDRHLAVA